ncbi:hypothetical protein HAX54_006243 [Datura stramonium]|uniref:Uncharacterized protein n=1 Tax=Datura stramonium TaxID=4076 RepID=A0ABS8TCI9_DATST|nr:hypothetical protein [Datura stramonium]
MLRAEGVVDLATKSEKDAPSFKNLTLTLGPSALLTEMSEYTFVSPMADRPISPPTSGLLKMAQMDHPHNAQLLKLSKAIPPIIQQAIKTVMMPILDKLRSFCARVLKEEVVVMMEKMDSPSKGVVAGELQDGEPPHDEVLLPMMLPSMVTHIGYLRSILSMKAGPCQTNG